jgi:hypothetical protein
MKTFYRYSILASILISFGTIHSEWRNCNFTNAEEKQVFDAFFEHFMNVDPGPDVMLDPKCNIDVLCSENSVGSEASFTADCRLLKAEGTDISKMKPTGQRHKFSKTVLFKKGQKPRLKD